MIPNKHPTFWDRIYLKIYPKYLYPGELCQAETVINVGVIHRLPDVKPYWKIMDYLYLNYGTVFRFLGLSKNLKLTGDVQPLYSILEIIKPVIDERKSMGKQVSPGDLICITPYDRQFIMAGSPDTSKSILPYNT